MQICADCTLMFTEGGSDVLRVAEWVHMCHYGIQKGASPILECLLVTSAAARPIAECLLVTSPAASPLAECLLITSAAASPVAECFLVTSLAASPIAECLLVTSAADFPNIAYPAQDAKDRPAMSEVGHEHSSKVGGGP
eukprot:1160680-Pelagomonas_calceolata.AAC.3